MGFCLGGPIMDSNDYIEKYNDEHILSLPVTFTIYLRTYLTY